MGDIEEKEVESPRNCTTAELSSRSRDIGIKKLFCRRTLWKSTMSKKRTLTLDSSYTANCELGSVNALGSHNQLQRVK